MEVLQVETDFFRGPIGARPVGTSINRPPLALKMYKWRRGGVGGGRWGWRPAAQESLCWPLPCQTAVRYICSQKINSALPHPGSSQRTLETQRRVGGHPQAPGSWAGRAAGSLPNSPESKFPEVGIPEV